MSNLSDVTGSQHLYGGTKFSLTNDRFNKSNQSISLLEGYLQIPSGDYFTNDFTITAWINLKVNSTYFTTIVDFGNGYPSDNIWFGFYNTLLLAYIYRQDGNIKSYITGMELSLNEWYHVGFVLKGIKGYLYVNGNLTSKRHFMLVPLEVSRTQNFIGGSNWNDPYLSAFIDEIKIYNGALNSSQIIDEYRSIEKPIKKSNKLIYAFFSCVLFVIILTAGTISLKCLKFLNFFF